jgi:hypothetical protein
VHFIFDGFAKKQLIVWFFLEGTSEQGSWTSSQVLIRCGQRLLVPYIPSWQVLSSVFLDTILFPSLQCVSPKNRLTVWGRMSPVFRSCETSCGALDYRIFVRAALAFQFAFVHQASVVPLPHADMRPALIPNMATAAYLLFCVSTAGFQDL